MTFERSVVMTEARNGTDHDLIAIVAGPVGQSVAERTRAAGRR